MLRIPARPRICRTGSPGSAKADLRAFQFTAGTALARNQLNATFAGEGRKLDLRACFSAGAREHIDTTLVVDHAVPACVSRELFKGVLDGRARGIFQGRVMVRPDAQKTDGKQMAQALMLSADAEFDSKPELEIYRRRRGVRARRTVRRDRRGHDVLPAARAAFRKAEARALLIESFVGEAIDKVEDESVRGALMGIARERLARRLMSATHGEP